jgi:fibronectin type 3 domain-containing protein
MMCGRSVFFLSTCFAVLSACVSVDKPQAVAGCVKAGQCIDNIRWVNDAQPIPGAQEDGGLNLDDARTKVPVEAAADIPLSASPDSAVGPDAPVPAGACWSNGSPVAAGTVCRPAIGLCDVDEVCDGVNAACPLDKYAPAAAACRPAAGDCDIAESCTGSSPDCPIDTFLSAGAICRPAAGLCDVAESCSGTAAECPIDDMVPAGTECRVSKDGNKCDPAETCTGSEATCPVDAIYAPPAMPTAVVAVAGVLQATISWAVAEGATGYNVKRSTRTGGYTIQGTPPTTTALLYLNTGLTGVATYYYVVSSVNTITSCESADSAPATAKPTGTCSPPAAPTVIPTPSNGQVLLSWTPSAGATSYTVARGTTTGAYSSIAKVTTGTSYKDINVTNGTTYYYVVTANNDACSSENSIEVSAAPTCTPTAAPTKLAVTVNNGSVALTWTAPTGAVSYRILRSATPGSGYTLVGTSGTAGYTDTSVVNGTTYYYVVTASNGTCDSVNSAEVAATPNCSPPSVPTNLKATATNAQIVLAWTPSTGGATVYQVFRSTTAGGPYATPLASPSSPGYTDTSVVNGTTYFYVVSASNGSCSSVNSAEVSAAPLCIPPSVPTGLAATAGDGKVTLSWTASTGGPTAYTVSRATVNGGPYAAIGSPTGVTYADSAVVNGTTYYYVVSSFNGTCSSAASAQVTAMPSPGCTQVAPTGVTAIAGSQKVTLSWTAAAGATSYNIGRSTTSGSGYASVGSVNAPTVTFVDTDTTLVNGTKYYFVVTAASGTCSSPNSAEVSATPACAALAAPTGVTAAANNSNGRITVAWTAVTDATAYTVSRGTASGGPFAVVSTNQTAINYADQTGLTGGTVYYYVVQATNAGGTCSSANSSPAVSARSCTVPSVPNGVAATAGISRVTVSWTASSGSPDSYEVKRGTASGGPFTSIGTPTASPFVDSNVTNGTTYHYVVAARNGGGNCSSADSGSSSAAPRSCTVVSGTTASGQSGPFDTTGGKCFVTCDTIVGWGCSNTDGRTVRINGSQLNCGATPIPAAKRSGYNVIDVTPGTLTYASVYWWNIYNNTCSIPSGGLDF